MEGCRFGASTIFVQLYSKKYGLKSLISPTDERRCDIYRFYFELPNKQVDCLNKNCPISLLGRTVMNFLIKIITISPHLKKINQGRVGKVEHRAKTKSFKMSKKMYPPGDICGSCRSNSSNHAQEISRLKIENYSKNN